MPRFASTHPLTGPRRYLFVNPIIVIPARMASTRLPGKPLADIHGRPMIVHVLDRAREAGLGPVAVACAEEEIAAAVRAAIRKRHSQLLRPLRQAPLPSATTTARIRSVWPGCLQ